MASDTWGLADASDCISCCSSLTVCWCSFCTLSIAAQCARSRASIFSECARSSSCRLSSRFASSAPCSDDEAAVCCPGACIVLCCNWRCKSAICWPRSMTCDCRRVRAELATSCARRRFSISLLAWSSSSKASSALKPCCATWSSD